MSVFRKIVCVLMLLLVFTGCGSQQNNSSLPEDAIAIDLSDDVIKVNGKKADSNQEEAVYIANDIISHESDEEHTVVHITRAGIYGISGTLSHGQIAVDLGNDAKENPDAVVTLILNDAKITCQAAPAVIFYNVYECGSGDTTSATKDVDTASAGANVIIADETTNVINGAYVDDEDNGHSYDGAFYSKMSMNVDGGEKGTGILNINASNEGLGTERHLTINGGNINIESGNDGINTNEDGISVATINGGSVNVKVTGETGEGDGIDSNGWLVINGGEVIAAACSDSADAGIDADMGIHINGGTVIASGNMMDRIENGGQDYAVFSLTEKQAGPEKVYMKNEADEKVAEFSIENDYSIVIYSSPKVTEETYTLWGEDNKSKGQSGGMAGEPGMPPGERPEMASPPM